MIGKIKSKLSALTLSRRLRLGAMSIIMIASIVGATLLNSSIHTIRIFDGKETYTVRSFNKNVSMAIECSDLKSEIYEITNSKTTNNITSVEIAYGYPVYITRGNETHEITFFGGDVKSALLQAGFTPDKYDIIEPSLDTVLTSTTYIDYTDIDYVKTTKTEKIPHKTKKVYSSKLNKGTTKVTAEGIDGVKKVVLTEKTINGVCVESKETAVVVSKPVTEKISIGTKTANAPKKQSNNKGQISTLSPKSEIKLDKNGVPVNYKSKMTVRATAYTHTGNPCATGVMPQPGHIAVNPKVIPYGTKMFIKTVDGKYIYGYAVAADTGGFVKKHPTGIDLFFNTESECRNFGVRYAEIYILE